VSNERSRGGFSVSSSDTSTTSLDSSRGISELILVRSRRMDHCLCIVLFSNALQSKEDEPPSGRRPY